MKIISFFLFILIINSLTFISFSQNLNEISDFEFEKYAVEQGTAMNASIVVFEDVFGFIWLGSQSGVDRFDGYDFKNFADVSSDSTSTNLKWVNSISQDSLGNIWASDQFGNVSNYKRSENKWINYYPIYKDSLTNIPEGANTNFFPQPRSILSTKDGRYAFVGVFGFGLVRIDSETGFQKFYQNDFKYTRGFDISNADKMINEMEWLDDENILLATGNGFRIFNIKKDDYIQEYFKNENINYNVESDKRYWIRNFEIADKNEVYASVNEGEVFLFNFEDSSIVNISKKIKLTETNASDLLLDKSNNKLISF